MFIPFPLRPLRRYDSGGVEEVDKWLSDTCAPDKFAGTFCCWRVILRASVRIEGRAISVVISGRILKIWVTP